MRHPTIPAPVMAWLKTVRAWRPNLRSMRFWTEVAVIVTYILHGVWAGLWVYHGLRSELLNLATWNSFLLALVLVLVHRANNRTSFRTLLPITGWAILMGLGGAITYIGFRHPPGNGQIVFFGLLGVLAPLVGQALDVRSVTKHTRQGNTL